MKYLSAILRYFDRMDYKYTDDIPVWLADAYKHRQGITMNQYIDFVSKIETPFFRINKVKRDDLAREIFLKLEKIKTQSVAPISAFEKAREFCSQYLEIPIEHENRFRRENMIDEFETVKRPHDKLVQSLNNLLQKISASHQIILHGVKEYSGVDLSKSFNDTNIGFQVKSKNDDISEKIIRAQTSKALEYRMGGFVFLYGRAKSGKVETSIQAAYHHFQRMNERKEIYCSVISPDVFAELMVLYSVSLTS